MSRGVRIQFNDGTWSEVPQYRCHKVVGALKIARIERVTADMGLIYFEEEGFKPVTVTMRWVAEKQAAAGGYLVIYQDGYKSFSPAKPFEDGYTRIEQADSGSE